MLKTTAKINNKMSLEQEKCSICFDPLTSCGMGCDEKDCECEVHKPEYIDIPVEILHKNNKEKTHKTHKFHKSCIVKYHNFNSGECFICPLCKDEIEDTAPHLFDLKGEKSRNYYFEEKRDDIYRQCLDLLNISVPYLFSVFGNEEVEKEIRVWCFKKILPQLVGSVSTFILDLFVGNMSFELKCEFYEIAIDRYPEIHQMFMRNKPLITVFLEEKKETIALVPDNSMKDIFRLYNRYYPSKEWIENVNLKLLFFCNVPETIRLLDEIYPEYKEKYATTLKYIQMFDNDEFIEKWDALNKPF